MTDQIRAVSLPAYERRQARALPCGTKWSPCATTGSASSPKFARRQALRQTTSRPAVHVDRRAGDKGRGVAHQEIHHRGDFLRLAGAAERAALARSFATCGVRAPIAVLIRPGAMAFTRMPCRPSRVPRLFVRLMTAAFEAPYSTTVLPRWPADEAVLTIAPADLPRSAASPPIARRRTARAR